MSPRPFDSHIHLQHVDNFPGCIQQADMLVPAITRDEWSGIMELSGRYTSVQGAIGIHPWRAHELDRAALKAAVVEADALLRRNPHLCIGEIGLDFDRRTPASRIWQIEVLEAFLDLAQRYSRPVTLHLRKGFDVFARLVRQYPHVRGFLHGFSGGVNWARHFCEGGRFKVGVNGVICRDNAVRYHDLVRTVPLDWLVLETDGPYVALPGQEAFTCEDIHVVAARVAALRGVEADMVIEQTARNVREMLHAG